MICKALGALLGASATPAQQAQLCTMVVRDQTPTLPYTPHLNLRWSGHLEKAEVLVLDLLLDIFHLAKGVSAQPKPKRNPQP